MKRKLHSNEITDAHLISIVELVKADKRLEADKAFNEFCAGIKDLKSFEAHMLGIKVLRLAGKKA